jgi:hypothetical protein
LIAWRGGLPGWIDGGRSSDGSNGFGTSSTRRHVRTIIVETASSVCPGFRMLRGRGIDLIAADSPTTFLDDGPTSILILQILGAVKSDPRRQALRRPRPQAQIDRQKGRRP